ncbi:MAG: vanadium-dependent haloperoxidase [Planctomycetes bacterium]|nr:vanadium-dependent haloperoxidase [Planctomycetota bacterium]
MNRVSMPTRLPAPAWESLEPRLLLSTAYTPGDDVILYWNQVAMDALLADSQAEAPQQGGPTPASRAAAIVFAAMADAYAAVTGEFEPYLVDGTCPQADVLAAVSQSAHDTLSALFSDQRPAFDDALDDVLEAVPDGQAEQKGVTFGASVAGEILGARENDNADAAVAYTLRGVLGSYAVDPLHLDQTPLTPGWGRVTPYAIESSTQFGPPPFPALTSEDYAAVFNEVKAVGAADAETADRDGDGVPDRTPEQTEIGLFWAYDSGLGTPMRLYDQVLVAVADQQDNTVGQNARLFGLAFLAMADAGITAWQAKYEYDVWRPVLGIRYAAVDGNSDTFEETDWTPLGAPDHLGGTPFTPPFPSYTSGHATFGGALFEVLRRFYGTDEIAFSLTSEETGTTRQYDTLSQPQQENLLSRLYLGVHWRSDQVEGDIDGVEIGEYVYDHVYTPTPARLDSLATCDVPGLPKGAVT